MTTGTDYSPIPEGVRGVYRGLENELVFMSFNWTTFRDLFAKNPVRLQLLMEMAGSFFFDVHVGRSFSRVLLTSEVKAHQRPAYVGS